VVISAKLREVSLQISLAPLSMAMPPSSSAFKAIKDAKAVQIDAEDPAKTVQIGSGLNPK
jgi:hypothetical protein